MAAFDQSDLRRIAARAGLAGDVIHPRTGRIDDDFRVDRHFRARIDAQSGAPMPAFGLQAFAFSASHNGCAAIGGVDSIQNHQSRVFDPTIRIFESFIEVLVQWIEHATIAARQRLGCGQ